MVIVCQGSIDRFEDSGMLEIRSYIVLGFLVGAFAASIFWTSVLSSLPLPYNTENQQGVKEANKEIAQISSEERIANYN
jgi:hypothetical protein